MNKEKLIIDGKSHIVIEGESHCNRCGKWLNEDSYAVLNTKMHASDGKEYEAVRVICEECLDSYRNWFAMW